MKTANKIYETTNYALFTPHTMNRLIDDKPPRTELVTSMRENGFRDSNPMHVVKSGRLYIIKQGHNRFKAAQKAGVPVKFVVTADDGMLPQSYEPEKAWSLRDILSAYVKQNKKPYVYAKGYIDRYRMPLNAAIQLLSKGDLGQTGSVTKDFRYGNFNIKNVAFAEEIGATVTFCRRFLPFAGKQAFIAALVRCSKVDGFDLDRFEKKVKAHHTRFDEQPNLGKYIDAIEEMYNHHVKKSDTKPIAIFAKQLQS